MGIVYQVHSRCNAFPPDHAVAVVVFVALRFVENFLHRTAVPFGGRNWFENWLLFFLLVPRTGLRFSKRVDLMSEEGLHVFIHAVNKTSLMEDETHTSVV